mmetsp:Transcript_34564/g.91215  ORF Transcript_34564/g.91215 Transcript_34564/m.91215 type:complete len:246 (+) Transcript_34564:227-964(+)
MPVERRKYSSASTPVAATILRASRMSDALSGRSRAAASPSLLLPPPAAGTGAARAAAADSSRRSSCTGARSAARQSSLRSDPLYPSVSLARVSKSSPASTASSLSSLRRISLRCASPGASMRKGLGSRRRIALSMAHGRFVAPITTTCASLSLAMPSHSAMNSAFILATDSWSESLRSRRKASISSMKMMHGWSFHARVNTARVSFCDSPNHLSCRVERLMLRKTALVSRAMAFASIVLPVPGGP